MRPEYSQYISQEEHGQTREQNLWISPDIGLVDGVVLAPGESRMVKIQLNPNSLPDLRYTPLEAIRSLRGNTRSRFGQVFLDFENPAEYIYQHLLQNGINDISTTDPELLQPEIPVSNYAMRPNKIQGDVLALYHPGGRHLVGDELLQSSMRINGKPIPEDMLRVNAQGIPVALRLMLDPETRMWIPPSKDIMEVDPQGPQQRGQITSLLKGVPETEAIIPYLVYSKDKITWPQNIYGIVRNFAYSQDTGKETPQTVSTHGTSQLFEPGRDWHMVFELRGRTTPDAVANYIDVDLFATTHQ